MNRKEDPLPTSNKFCFLFKLKPAVAIYVLVEYIVWILFLLSALNLELDCLEKTDLLEFTNVLRGDLYYNVIFGKVEPIPHDNARCKLRISHNYSTHLKSVSLLSICYFPKYNFGRSFPYLLHIHAFSAGWNFKGNTELK